MRRFVARALLALLLVFVALQLVLGSAPVQRRILKVLTDELGALGVDATIESVEFSTGLPRLYLNRVKLAPREKSAIPLVEPVQMDKVRIEFQPLALLYRTILVRSVLVYNPRLRHPDTERLADAILEEVKRLSKQKETETKSRWNVSVRSVGVIDAIVDLKWVSESLHVASPSFSATARFDTPTHQEITVGARKLHLVRGKLDLDDVSVDVEFERSGAGIRVSKLSLDGPGLAVGARGTVTLDKKGAKQLPRGALTLDLKVPLGLLQRIPELKAPPVAGTVAFVGDIDTREALEARGKVRYENIVVTDDEDEIHIEDGRFGIMVEREEARLSDLDLRWSGGRVSGNDLRVRLDGSMPVKGTVQASGLRLEQLLKNVSAGVFPTYLGIDGPVDVTGSLRPFQLVLDARVDVQNFVVTTDPEKPRTPETTVIAAGDGHVDARFVFTPEQMTIGADVSLLGEGKSRVDGVLEFNRGARFKFACKKFSLTKLGLIAELPVLGTVDIDAELNDDAGHIRVGGNFAAKEASFADIGLGSVTGKITFQNKLLAFERLEMTSLEPVVGHGFVDFAPKLAHYRFEVDAKRAEVGQVFRSLAKLDLPFEVPEGGDLTARLAFEGGHDRDGMELTSSGKARAFKWYGESWSSAAYQLRYRPQRFRLDHLLLSKGAGGLSLRGDFRGGQAELDASALKLRIEEFQYAASSGLGGEANGATRLRFDRGKITAIDGEVALTSVRYRNRRVPDLTLNGKSENDAWTVRARAGGDAQGALEAQYRRRASGAHELKLTLKQHDVAPWLSLATGFDLGSLTDFTASGAAELSSQKAGWDNLEGSGRFTEFALGLRGTPLKAEGPISFKLSPREVVVERFALVGNEGRVRGALHWRHEGVVKGDLDGVLDFQFLQPFIPGVDYGAGPVTVGVRLSGPSDRFDVVGNLTLTDGTLRLGGMTDEFRNVQARVGLDAQRATLYRFDASLGEGSVKVGGTVRHSRFRTFAPNLKIDVENGSFKAYPDLAIRGSANLTLRGDGAPFLMAGRARLEEVRLTSFTPPKKSEIPETGPPPLAFDVQVEAPRNLQVSTDLLKASFHGNFRLVGNTRAIGLLGAVDADAGAMRFRDTEFRLNTGNVRFESGSQVLPRFAMAGRALVREQSNVQGPTQAETYEITLNVTGTPTDYRIRLSSSPALPENDIVSLLMLGFVGRQAGREGNYADLGGAVAGQIPLQSKIQDTLGFDVRVKSTRSQNPFLGLGTGAVNDSAGPSVQIQKDVTKKTKLSYSSSLDAVPVQEFKIEQILDDNLTVNATVVGNPRGNTSSTNQQSSQSYGIDFRYRFSFE